MPFYNPQEYGQPLQILDEGIILTNSAASINFIGAGVTATESNNNITVNIPGGGGSTSFANSVSFSVGTINGVNTAFTWPNVPLNGMNVFLNGNLQTPGVDYSLAGATVTFFIPPAPGSGIVASYEY